MKRKALITTTALAGIVATATAVYFSSVKTNEPGPATNQLPQQAATANQDSSAIQKAVTQTPGPAMTAKQASPEEPLSVEELLRAGDEEMLEKYGFSEREVALANIDLEALKEKYPNNLYWEMAAPTQDEALKEQRKDTRDYWRQQRNQISANLADEYTIREYYTYQNALSEDYVAVTDDILDNYSEGLSESDYRMLLMANRLHAKRLQEIPGQLDKSLQHRRDFLARQASWHQDPKAYEEKLRLEREAALQALAANSEGAADEP